jgi:hypothetical protein
VVKLKDKKGKSFQQIANYYGIQKSMAHKIYHRAKKKAAQPKMKRLGVVFTRFTTPLTTLSEFSRGLPGQTAFPHYEEALDGEWEDFFDVDYIETAARAV